MPLAAILRSLARSPGFSAAVVVTLALGIGMLAVTFSVVHAALFRQPPFEDAERLAMLHLERNPRGETPRLERWSFARFEMLRERQRSFEEVASYSPATLTIAGDGGAEPIEGERVSASYFRVLRSGAARGRLFTEEDDDAARPSAVVVLGHDLWTRRFGGDPAVLGRSIRLNGVPLTVIGILPPGFEGLSGRAEVFVPRTMAPRITYPEYLTTNQNFISAVGRLRPGVDLAAARSELALLGTEIQRELPSDPSFPEERVTATAIALEDARTSPGVERSLLVLFAAVGALHLLACANVTNLLLGRAASRRRDCAVLVALGSGTRRLFGHLLAEGALLASVGALLGVALAWLGSSLVAPPTNVWAARNFYGSLAPFDEPSFGAPELLFALAASLATALLVALLPALAAFRVDVPAGIKAGARAIAGGSMRLRRPSGRGLLVAVEAALAMLLLVLAAFLVESFRRMLEAGVGVQPTGVLTFRVMPSEAAVPPEDAPAFVSRLLEAIAAAPGVVSASVDGGAPLSGSASSTLFVAGRPAPAPGEAPPVLRHYVGPDHFATLGIPLLRGRTFDEADDAGAPRVAVISETAARRFFGDEDPIGQRVWFGGGSSFDAPKRSAEIVGVVGDVVYAPLDMRPNLASFYTPYRQFTYAMREVFVRAADDPLEVLPSVRSAIARVYPELALHEVAPLTEVMRASWARNRFDAFLFGGFGVVAVLLAASGIFAVVSYAVAARTRELGLRMALGADARRLLREVFREGLALPGVGLLVGLAAALVAGRWLGSSLYEISPFDLRVYACAALLLLAVAGAATLVPARRATRVDAVDALRAE